MHSNRKAESSPLVKLPCATSSKHSVVFPVLTTRLWFPDPRSAKKGGEFDGLVAIGGDLSVPRLLLAYGNGIFPWTDNPITWWSPDPRAIFDLDRFHVSESLARVLRQGVFEVTRDRAFRRVVEGCAAPAPGRESTWISPRFIEALRRLAQAIEMNCAFEHPIEGVKPLNR